MTLEPVVLRGDSVVLEPLRTDHVDGLVAYDAGELPALLGRRTTDLDPEYRREVVHRDEMVLVGRRTAG